MVIHDAIAAIDHDGRRSIPLKESLLYRECRCRSLGASPHERFQGLIFDEPVGGNSRQFQQALRPISFPPIDPPLDIDRPKQLLDRGARISRAQQQVAALAEREVQQFQHVDLKLRFKVNQQVPTSADVHLGERRVAQHILGGKHHRVANLLLDAIRMLIFLEEARQPIRRQLPFDAPRVDRCACHAEGLLGGVRRKDLHLKTFSKPLHLLVDQHR